MVRGPAHAEQDRATRTASKFNGWYPDRMRSAENKWDDVFAGRKGQWDYAVDLANWTPAAPLPLHAPAARGDDRLLVQPLPRAVDARHRLVVAQRLRPDAAQARARQLRRPARRRQPASGDAALPEQLRVDQGRARTRTRAASCSSCTRSDARRATPRTWSRTRRGSSPATPSMRGTTGSRTTTRTIHATGRVQGARLHVCQPQRRRPQGDPRVPPLPRPPPGDGAQHRPQAGDPLRLRRRRRRRWSTTWPRTFRESGTSIKATLRALVAHPEFARSADAQGAQPDRGLRRHRARARRPGQAAAPV